MQGILTIASKPLRRAQILLGKWIVYVLMVGGLIEQVGVAIGNSASRYIGTAISLVSPTDALWRLAANEMMPRYLSQLQGSPFASASVPSAAMVWWSVALVAVILMLGIRAFQKRPL